MQCFAKIFFIIGYLWAIKKILPFYFGKGFQKDKFAILDIWKLHRPLKQSDKQRGYNIYIICIDNSVTEYKFHHNVCSSEILLCRKSSIRYYPYIIFHPMP